MILPYSGLRTFLRHERATRRGPVRPHLLARGFVSQRAELYPFDRWHPRWFLTDWDIEVRIPRVNPPAAASILTNKVFFHLFNRALAEPLPTATLVGLADKGRFLPLGGGSLEAAQARWGGLVVKPVAGAGGRGVRLAASPAEALAETGAEKEIALIETPIEPHAYAAAIFPGALNTIRVITCREDGGAPFIAAAAHRFGTSATAPIDSFKAGGLSALVELDTGRLSVARSNPTRSNPGRHAADRTAAGWHETHPDTGARIAGTAVAHWPDAKALALRAAASVPGLRLAGWDIAIGRHGPILVEGNARVPNPNLVQAHLPLLCDAPTRRFFRAVGVLSERRFRRLEKAARAPTHELAT